MPRGTPRSTDHTENEKRKRARRSAWPLTAHCTLVTARTGQSNGQPRVWLSESAMMRRRADAALDSPDSPRPRTTPHARRNGARTPKHAPRGPGTLPALARGAGSRFGRDRACHCAPFFSPKPPCMPLAPALSHEYSRGLHHGLHLNLRSCRGLWQPLGSLCGRLGSGRLGSLCGGRARH